MNNLILLGFAVLYILLISIISQELGITNLAITPIVEPSAPDTGSVFSALVNIAVTAINLIWSFVQLITYQVDGIPVLMNTLIMTPLAFMIGYLFTRVIRGGG